MTDFDQLIKEKADSAHFQYKASAWKHLASQAGFKVGLSGLQIAFVSIALVAVVGGAIFFFTPDQNTSTPAPQQNCTTAVVADTTTAQPAAATSETHCSHQCNNVCKSTTTTQPAEPTISTEPESTTQPSTISPKTEITKDKPRYRRTVRINVDTITDNLPTDEQLRQANSNL